jgi:hypothetical protein
MAIDEKKLKDRVFNRRRVLRDERDHYATDWRELSDFVMGSRGRFLPGDGDNQDEATHRRNERLYNEVAKMSANILSAGMMAGITSPARPWFKLTHPDPELEEYAPVKLWLDDVQRVILQIFARSNFYNTMQNIYLELGIFGTACMCAYENFDNVLRYEPYTIGSFTLALDGERNVDTMYREYRTTVGSVVKRFGTDAVSRTVKNLWDRGDYDSKLNVIHAIEPNVDRDYGSPLARNMPYRSVYYEEGGDGYKPLLISGFQEKPFMAPRWSVIAEDVYASSYPGIDSLASNKSLQIEELDKAIAIEKMHNPPLVGDSSLKQAGAELIAGGITYIPNMAATGKAGLSPVYDVNPRIMELVQSIQEKEERIRRFFYADLFLMVTELDRAQITATEIAERKEEKMLMLGPVLERLNNELLDPVIDRTFAVAQRAGILPPPPPELEDADLRVEYVSVLAQAQRAVSTASVEATVAFAGNMSQIWPEARHKIDPYQAIDDYARAKGASPKIIRTDDEAQQAAAAEQQMMQMQQAAAMGAGAAESAKTLSETDTGNPDSALAMLSGAVA